MNTTQISCFVPNKSKDNVSMSIDYSRPHHIFTTELQFHLPWSTRRPRLFMQCGHISGIPYHSLHDQFEMSVNNWTLNHDAVMLDTVFWSVVSIAYTRGWLQSMLLLSVERTLMHTGSKLAQVLRLSRITRLKFTAGVPYYIFGTRFCSCTVLTCISKYPVDGIIV